MLSTLSKETDKPLKIGITGGIGSGKSLICKIFQILKVPVFEADGVAKLIMNQNPGVRSALIGLFGDTIYDEEGNLYRQAMAQKIFNNQNLLEKVNGIVHPVVRQKFREWWMQQTAPYVIQEAAILFESGVYKFMDLNILILSSEELRIKRLAGRDGLTTQQIKARMDNQWTDDEKLPLADFVIYNCEKEFIINQILNIHQTILNYGKVC